MSPYVQQKRFEDAILKWGNYCRREGRVIEVREAIGERKDSIQLAVKMEKLSRTQF